MLTAATGAAHATQERNAAQTATAGHYSAKTMHAKLRRAQTMCRIRMKETQTAEEYAQNVLKTGNATKTMTAAQGFALLQSAGSSRYALTAFSHRESLM